MKSYCSNTFQKFKFHKHLDLVRLWNVSRIFQMTVWWIGSFSFLWSIKRLFLSKLLPYYKSPLLPPATYYQLDWHFYFFDESNQCLLHHFENHPSLPLEVFPFVVADFSSWVINQLLIITERRVHSNLHHQFQLFRINRFQG